MDAKEGEGTEGDEGERGRVPRVILQFLIWVDSLEFGDQMHFFQGRPVEVRRPFLN